MNSRGQATAPDPQLERLRQHLRRQPDDGRAWLQLARTLAQAPPGPELHHAMEQAIRSLPEEDAPWRLAALLHERRAGAEAALRWLEGAVRQNPALRAPRAVLALLQGDGLRAQGRWESALQHYREAQRLRPDDPVLLNNLGSCLASLGELPEAERCFARVIGNHPGYAEARLNLGLLRALQGRDDEALREIDAAAGHDELPEPARRAARTLRALLVEHRRLAPAIAAALRGELGALQRALDETPEPLARPHRETVAQLRRLADRCREDRALRFPGQRTGDAAHPDLLEAFAHCKLPGGVEGLADLCQRLATEPAASVDEQRFLHALRVIRARRGQPPGALAGRDGEARLRCWHARLLGSDTQGRPGQYKLATNLVNGSPTTPAEFVPGTLRVLLQDILPNMPAGWASGVFLYDAVSIVHGFGDGNGRLARFLLAWATESAAGGALVIPLELRPAAAAALSALQRNADLRPQRELMREAWARTAEDLARLQTLGVAPPVTPR